MQVDVIEIFLALEKTHSISRAADELYMSRTGLSQKLASIEASYGRPLYMRTSTGLVPTKAGQIVTRYAKQVSQLEASLAAELAANDERFDSTLEIGMSLNDGVAAWACREVPPEAPQRPRALGGGIRARARAQGQGG